MLLGVPQTRSRPDGLLAAVFDFSFTTFVTLRLVRAAYVLIVVAAGVVALLVLIAGISRGGVAALGSLIVATLGFFFAITIARIGLEAAAVFFRIADHAAEVAEQAAQIALNTASAGVQCADRA